MNDDAYTDPRVARTKSHVLTLTRGLLAEGGPTKVSFSHVSRIARVGRQTLYNHFKTPERLIAEAILEGFEGEPSETPTSIRSAIVSRLRGIRGANEEPGSGVAMTSLTTLAYHDESSYEALRQISMQRYESFNTSMEAFGVDIGQDDYARMVGPIFYQLFFVRERPSDELIESIADSIAPLVEASFKKSKARSKTKAKPQVAVGKRKKG